MDNDLKMILEKERIEKLNEMSISGVKLRYFFTGFSIILALIWRIMGQSDMQYWQMIALLTMQVLNNLMVVYTTKIGKYNDFVETLVQIMDSFGIISLAYFSGMAASPFFLLLFVTLYVNAVKTGYKRGLLKLTTDIGVFFVMLLVARLTGREFNLIHQIGGIVFYTIIGYIFCLLGQRTLDRMIKFREIMGAVETTGKLDVRSRDDEKDELGYLQMSFNRMLDSLEKMAKQIGIIAEDRLFDKELETEIPGDLGDAKIKLLKKMRLLADAAKLIAEDNLEDDVLKVKMEGDIGNAFTHMVERLLKLAEFAKKLSQGDLTINGEELGNGTIGRVMKDMLSNLRIVIQQIKEAGLRIASASNEILSSTEELSAGSSEQASSVEEVTATIEEFSNTSRQIAGTAEMVEEQANNSLKKTIESTASMENAAQAMNDIRGSAENTSKRILELGHKSEKIDEVAQFINEIASQTKLLSLNASIEAAGAGEAGKRFSVVAEEIRNLAENVSQSAGEITDLIKEIRNSINASIMSTEEELKKVNAGVDLTNSVTVNLNEVYSTIDKTTQLSREIRTGTDQQKSASEQIVVTMKEISSVVQQSAISTEQVSKSAEDLNKLAEDFKETLEKFKVED